MIFCLAAGMVMAQPALKVASGGEVGVGTATPTAELHLVGAMKIVPKTGILATLGGNSGDQRISIINNTTQENSSTYLTMNGSTTNGAFVFNGKDIRFLVNKASGNFGEFKMILDDQGRLGINTVTPGFDLEVNGSAGKPGGGSFVASSDRRLKKNISEYSSGLKEVLQINPVTFQYNGKGNTKDNGDTFVGVIAQEYKKIEPAAVELRPMVQASTSVEKDQKGNGIIHKNITSTEDYLTVDPSSLPYMLVNAIQDQQSIIEEQNEKIIELESKMFSILAQLEDLALTELNTQGKENVTLSSAYVKQKHSEPI